MIAVVALPALRPGDGGPDRAAGLGAVAARAAVEAGGRVELVGKIGDDGAGDALVLALARDGIGHAALQRDPAHPTPLVQLAAAASPDDEVADETLGQVLVAGTGEPGAEPPASAAAGPGSPVGPALLPNDAGVRPGLDGPDVELALRYLADVRVVVVTEPLAGATAAAVAGAAAFGGAQLVAVIPAGSEPPAPFGSATVLEAPADDPDDRFGILLGTYAAGLDAGSPPEQAFEQAVVRAGWEAAGA
ncbi:MAG TPA: hypothetical protein VF763_05765 [Candidatus Limnocylindrales bacterium]